MRLNNRSARLIMNDWLVRNEHRSLSADFSYVKFATELRKFTAPTLVQIPFVDRPEATRYIRDMAAQYGVRS